MRQTAAIWILCVLSIAFFSAIQAAEFNLKFEVVQNDGVNEGEFKVRVLLNASLDHFSMGSGNFVFNYNTAALKEPALLEGLGINDGTYLPLTLGEPVPGRLSLNIELGGPSQGGAVSSDDISVAVVGFKIIDAAQHAELNWRVQRPNATVLFADDEHTLLPAGSLSGVDVPLPIHVTGEESSQIVKEFTVFQNYPNPFNPLTHIKYGLPKQAFVSVSVYNIQGQLVATLFEGQQTAGYHIVGFDAANYASGVYFYKVQTPAYHEVKKMLLMK